MKSVNATDLQKRFGVRLEEKPSKTSTYQGMPLQLQGFLSAIDSFERMSDQDIAEFKKHSEIFRNEFSL